MKLRSCSPVDLQHIELAISLLREARALLGTAGAKKAHDYVAASIKSAEGAHRHCQRIIRR